ncbi:DUF1206 domain-containing protein [Bacillus sp. KH172YL63]|uniref:DUF1206 domain-containing protein n=1 Tax=Bacillus sp. KH172YL63 TaxID=2709784 RepID=UPI0013E43568|nr:DUF1206 domain-containing protein [Bacillus sp. KH172YL63]BCB05655.1 hypothetical protein KH172YL63_37880 [Bacillus sp. KH172YL63]
MARVSSITSSNERKQRPSVSPGDIKPWIKGFARIGYISRGTVYILIGALSVMAALGIGGSTSDSNGAFSAVASKPFGEILLWILGAGLIGIVLWRLIQVILDPEHVKNDGKSLFRRLTHLISGIAYASLTYNAFAIAMHAKSSGSGSGSKQTLSAKLLAQPFGQWIVGAVGLIIIGFALYEIHKAYTEKYTDKFKRSEMSEKEWELGRKTGKLGLYSRGIVFLLIGYFFVQTAITADPYKTKGLDGALQKIAQQPFGQWLLGIVALGLVLYGVFQILKGKNRHLSIY